MIFTDSTYDDEYLEESVDEISSWLKVVIDEYRESDSFLTLTNIQQENATFIIQIFVKNCYNYGRQFKYEAQFATS